jgi:fructose-1,6-bisphosphatase
MIAHVYLDLYQRVLGWFCGLASELELAHSGAVHPANEGDHFDYSHAQKKIVLGCIEFRKSISAQRNFPSSYRSAFNPKECERFGCR